MVLRGSTTVDEIFSERLKVLFERRVVERLLPLNGTLVEFASPT